MIDWVSLFTKKISNKLPPNCANLLTRKSFLFSPFRHSTSFLLSLHGVYEVHDSLILFLADLVLAASSGDCDFCSGGYLLEFSIASSNFCKNDMRGASAPKPLLQWIEATYFQTKQTPTFPMSLDEGENFIALHKDDARRHFIAFSNLTPGRIKLPERQTTEKMRLDIHKKRRLSPVFKKSNFMRAHNVS